MHQPSRSWVLSWLQWPFKQLHALLLEQPLRQLYFKGPALLGFWSGLNNADICTALNPGTSALFWTSHATTEEQCSTLVEQRFHAFFVSINVILYAYVVYRLVTTLAYYVFVVKPALKKLELVFKHDDPLHHVDTRTLSLVRSHDPARMLHRTVCGDQSCQCHSQTPGNLHDPAGVSGSNQRRARAVHQKVKVVYSEPPSC
jgi:hypothetical protein